MNELTHFDAAGNAIMVDVTEKKVTERIAVATGSITMNQDTFHAVVTGTAKKGDVLAVARVAGIMAAKKTWELIPMCHPLMLTKCTVDFEIDDAQRKIKAIATTKVVGQTGIEMEALTAATTALLTIYDMCKAMDRAMEISEIHILKKDGGKSGLFEHSRRGGVE
ncbi:MAG: cyclic pyranopterin monophosphate synthase MoaC [Velocimicrobium sp.]